MAKTDLTKYSDNELSLTVFNTESLYEIRHSDILFDVLRGYYEYTKEQLDVLKADLNQDIFEL